MSLRFELLKEVFANEPKFRLQQAIKAVYEQGISSWAEASVFSKALRDRLGSECSLDIEASDEISKDQNTIKTVFDFVGDKIEAVLMRHKGRNTVCVSTQVGCALKCSFCLTGEMGLRRNLTYNEMINQVLYFSRYLKGKDERVTNVVFMGMGEPFNNYDEVMQAVAKLNDAGLFNIGARHISISTSGVVPGIQKLAKEKMQINLSVSLHATSNELRDKMMPINKVYPIEVLLKTVNEYIRKTRRRVMIEYIMLKDVNDSVAHAKDLVRLLQSNLDELYFVNIIKYNQTGKYEASTPHSINVFKRILDQSGIAFVERYRFGQDVKGACGQLSADKQDDKN